MPRVIAAVLQGALSWASLLFCTANVAVAAILGGAYYSTSGEELMAIYGPEIILGKIVTVQLPLVVSWLLVVFAIAIMAYREDRKVPTVFAIESAITVGYRRRVKLSKRVLSPREYKLWKAAHLLIVVNEALNQRPVGSATQIECAGVAMQMHSIIRRLRTRANDPLVQAVGLRENDVQIIVSWRTEYANSVVELASVLAFTPRVEIVDLLEQARRAGVIPGNF